MSRVAIFMLLVVGFAALGAAAVWLVHERRKTAAIDRELDALRSGRILPVLRHGQITVCTVEDSSAGWCSSEARP